MSSAAMSVGPNIIHQPRPRRPNRDPTHTFTRRPERPTQPTFGLPTPTSSPAPTDDPPRGTHLTIADLVDRDARFGGTDTFGRALDTLGDHALGDLVLALERGDDEDEYMLSARPWSTGESETLWARLLEPEPEPEPEPDSDAEPEHLLAVQPSALAYLTPPSSPEIGARPHDVQVARGEQARLASASGLSPITDVPETSSLDDIPSFDLGDLTDTSQGSEHDPPSDEGPTNEILEHPSYDDHFDWPYDNDHDRNEIHNDGDGDGDGDGEMTNNELNTLTDEPDSPPPPYPHLPDPRQLPCFPNVPDLTSALDPLSFSDWPVARGGFGDVWKGALVEDHGVKSVDGASTKPKRPVAVKRLTMYTDAGEEGARKVIKRTTRELSIWSRLNHENVLPLLGTCSFRGGVGIVSEWQGNGNATAWVNANPYVDRLELCKGICTGLDYLHRSNVIHGDLRGANVLISPSGTPRLIDFGLASVVGPNPAFSASTTMAGTVRWMAPELQVTEGQRTTAASDVFAFGMTMLEMYTGSPPFADIKNDIAVLLKYQRGERPPRPIANTTTDGPRKRVGKREAVCVPMDDETWDLVQECWAQDPAARPSVGKVLEWFIRKTRLK